MLNDLFLNENYFENLKGQIPIFNFYHYTSKHFILKALFVLKIFRFLSWLVWSCRNYVNFLIYDVIDNFITTMHILDNNSWIKGSQETIGHLRSCLVFSCAFLFLHDMMKLFKDICSVWINPTSVELLFSQIDVKFFVKIQ